MKKIAIHSIDDALHSHRGFDEAGCFGCECKDECCRYGADFDRETHDLLQQHREDVEAQIGRKLEDCFEDDWTEDPDYLGGAIVSSRVDETGYCVFHMKGSKGCALFKLAVEKGLTPRLLPSICRLFPIVWTDGRLHLYDEGYTDEGTPLPRTCNCLDPKNCSGKSLFETQKKHIEDIFEIAEKPKK